MGRQEQLFAYDQTSVATYSGLFLRWCRAWFAVDDVGRFFVSGQVI